MMKLLSRGFVLLLPLLFVDAILDIAFFGSLELWLCLVAWLSTLTGRVHFSELVVLSVT